MAMAMSPNSEITWGFTDLGEDFSGVKSNLYGEWGRVWNAVGSREELSQWWSKEKSSI
jgi:hypothetical protein